MIRDCDCGQTVTAIMSNTVIIRANGLTFVRVIQGIIAGLVPTMQPANIMVLGASII